MSTPPAPRPDGRLESEELAALRAATRALRLHLDELPIDYDLAVPPERFLTQLAFMAARNRYQCVESLIGANFGAVTLGSIARSLFVDALRWLWIAEQPDRCRNLLGDLLEERSRICKTLDAEDADCHIAARWLMPLPDVADLTAGSLSWLDTPCMPTEDQLLEGYLAGTPFPQAVSRAGDEVASARAAMRALLEMAGLRGAVRVLAFAGHGNFLGLRQALTDDGVPGHDLRADHEALFMHVAAAGVVATLFGVADTIPEMWPADTARPPFLVKAVELALAVARTASPLHQLTSSRRPAPARGPIRAQPQPQSQPQPILHPGAVLEADQLLPDACSPAEVAELAEAFYRVASAVQIDARASGTPALHSILTLGGAASELEAVMTYDQPGSAVISAFAARNLLEEAARLQWRISVTGEEEFKARATQYFDEYRAAQKKTVDLLASSGVPRANAQKLFAFPSNVVDPGTPITKGRTPVPSITSLLRDLGAPYPQPGWLVVAYSLLSQVTHSTPLGLLHTVTVDADGAWHGNELSSQMLGLALDVACLGSALLLGNTALVLTNVSDEAQRYRRDLLIAAGRVHDAARLVHGLD